MDYIIHKTAIVDGSVVLGKNIRIHAFTQVLSGVVIGEGTTIGHNCFIGERVTIGRRCKIQGGCFIPEGVIIGDDVFIGPNATFTNVKYPRATITLRSKHDTRFKEAGYERTIVEERVTIGANATIVCGVRIHAEAMVGAGSVVTKNIPDGILVAGVPAKMMGFVNEKGQVTYSTYL